MNNNKSRLIEQIYTKRRSQYKDIRHLCTPKAITKRIDQVDRLIASMPPSERKDGNLGWKKLWIERRLLIWKRALYTNPIPELTLVRWQVELTDKCYGIKAGRDEEELKKDHLLPLLELNFYTTSEVELAHILAQIEATDYQQQ